MGCRKQRYLGWFFLISLICLRAPLVLGATKITSVDFKGTADPSEINIQADGPITFEKQENPADKQVIIEIQGASISKANSRKIDTSSFNSNVSLVSPYQVSGQKDKVRVVIQLREAGSADVTQEGNLLKVKVPNAASASAATGGDSTASAATAADTVSPQPPSLPSDTPPEPAPAAASNADQATTLLPDKANPDKTNLDTFVQAKESKKFVGRPVTLQVRDADVGDVLRLIGDASGFNILVGSDVTGKLTLSLVDVPWDQALDVVLHTLHLGAERNNNVLRIVTLANLTNEKMDELKAQKAAEASAPRVTRVFPVSYADLGDLSTIVTKFASTAAEQGGMAGIVQVDARTNSLVVRDLPEQIERMKKLIEILDTQTPQVVIEAKVIEATEGFSKSLTGSLGLSDSSTSPTMFASFAGGNPVDSLVGSPGVFTTGTAISNQSSPTGAPNGTFGLSPSLSFIPGSPRLNAVLSWGESENQLKIVSSPKTVVLNKQKANIVEGTPVLVPGTTTVAGVGTVPTATVQNANISLSVKPTVTNDASVLMDLTVSKDVPVTLSGGQGIGTRNMTTQVLVESGSTLVIGGIYTMQTSHASSGFPILRKIPILGALFGNDVEQTDRSELFFFITPRILNLKEAGLNG